jgi:hypothetical protein
VNKDDKELLELEPPRPANTSTSHTLVLSDEPPIDLETSAPTHVAPETSAPARIPRELKKKKARTGASGNEEIITGSLLTPLLDDVKYLLLSCYFLYLLGKISNFLILSFCLSTIFAARDEGYGQYRLPFYRVP